MPGPDGDAQGMLVAGMDFRMAYRRLIDAGEKPADAEDLAMVVWKWVLRVIENSEFQL